jgi:hypothetical protein
MSGGWWSRPRRSWSAAHVVACGPRPMAAARSGCATYPLAGGRWCGAGASGSGAVMSRPVGYGPGPSKCRDPSAGGADRASPGRGVPAGRHRRPRGRGGRPRPGVGWATIMRAVADHGRPLVDDPRGWTVSPPWAGRDQLPQGHPHSTHPVRHRPGRSGGWPAAGCGGRPHQGRGRRLARRPDPGLAGPGRHGRAGPWRGYASALVARSATPGWSWTTSTPSGSPTRWWIRSAAGPSRPPRASGRKPRSAVAHPQAAADGRRATHQPGTSPTAGWAGRR